ncbi:MAG: MogA/MoaB family molybdenum cofactor biosynthesis protein [Desulfobacterales bacterium]|nr:MogA/MoaB family molybdenum cofactor biosynthesis protein [Desulfobacterales bacterium]
MGAKEHKSKEYTKLRIGILTLSSTRTLEEDKSGNWIKKQSIKEGHEVIFHNVVIDDAEKISETVISVINELNPNVFILTGGTGLSPKDVTIEAITPLFNKEITAFGPLFAQLSFEEIDSAAILSRATAGIINQTVVFCIPGSLNACKLACNEFIFPEIGHIIMHVNE